MTGVAGVIRFHKRLQDTVTTTHKDTLSVEVNPKTGCFKDARVSDILTLGIDPNYGIYLKDSAFYTVTLSISGYNAANNLITSTSHTFKLTYNPFGKTPFRDQDLFLFNGAYKYKITYTGATKNGVAITSLPDYIYMDADIEVERYYAFSPSYLTSPFTLNASAVNIDCDANNIPDELMITWNKGFVCGANYVNPESYDLEWTFVNDYDSIPGSFVNSNRLTYDFVNNSTRINTTNTYYRISLVFEHGYILYRLRGVGVDTANVNSIIYGAWNIPNTGIVSSVANYPNTQPHQTDSMNWQYNASFAEEGKKKEVLAYYDGSLRNRQSVTKMNSDKNTLVGETIYDFQGRPAINVLPTPVDFPKTICDSTTQPALRFFANFNQDDSAHTYSRNDFDVDTSPGSCQISVAPMDTTSGASRYYSPANSNKLAQQAFLPDAQKFPFTQVEYTPDNTGRIKRQSGVGLTHQLNTGHETKYFYGQPNQTELDRMFGSEVGDATHYKENVVIDANGQASISYLNMEGKTVATCLAGDSTKNLLKLSSNQPPVLLTVDLFNKNAQGKSALDTLNVAGNSIDFNTQLLVAYPSKYSFAYNLQVDTLKDTCLNVCFSCIYDLEMHLYDDCGNDRLAQLLGNPLKKVVGHFSRDIHGNIVFNDSCKSPTLLTELDTFSLFLEAGNYTLSKTLAIDPNAANFYVAQYLDSSKNTCFTPLSSFVQSALNAVDTSNCNITCASCVAKLGDRDAFVAAGKGSYLDFDALVDACNEPCKAVSTCFATYMQMQTDMSPGGQYGDYLTSSDSINPFSFTLSVYNDTNKLPKNLCSAPANWHYPSVMVNNTTYPYYLDGNGHRTTINIQQIGVGYSPAVVDISKVYFTAATSTYYTYPENLKYFKDFLNYWNPSWAKSLVVYHPEYCYYVNCQTFGNKASGDFTTSDAFDGTLQSTNTFAKAVTNRFLKYNYHSFSFDKRLVDFSAPSDSLPYDPFILHGGSFGNKLKNLIANYQVINGSSLSMTEIAAYGARCGLLYGNTSNTGCINFGDSAVVDSIRNNEWNSFVGFYVSSKQALQSQYLDSAVKASGCPGYNACFGDSNNTYNGSVALGAEFTDRCQPCSNGTSYLYIGKAKRFGSAAAFIPATTPNQAQYQNYLQTGQCPTASGLQGLINQLASNGQVQAATSVPLQNYPTLTPELYTALGGGGAHYKKFYWNSSTSGLLINAIFTDSLGNTQCTLSLDLSSSGLSSLSGYNIVAVSGLADTTFGSNTNAFRIYLALSDVSHHITYKKALGYSSCFNITDCKFQQQCSPNDFAGDLQKLMSALAANNQLYTNNVSLNSSVFATYVTVPIKNQLGTNTSNQLIWNFVDTTHYQIYDVLNPTTKLLINYINRTANLNSLAIKSFSNVNSNYYNLYTMTPLNSTNATLGVIEGEVFKQVDTNLYSISLGSCGYGASLFSCQGNAYKLQNQLQLLLHDALVTMPSNHSVDLTKLPDYSYLIGSQLPNGLSATSSTLQTNVSGLTSPYTTQLVFTVKTLADSCPFSLTAKASLGFDSIVNFSNLQGYGNVDGFGNFLQFKGLAKYKISGSILSDTIFGQSCLPIKNCCACGTDTVPFSGTGSGTGSGTSGNGGAGTGDYNSASDTCLSAYLTYTNTIYNVTHYVNGDWKNKIPTLSYSDITQGDYCGCLERYDSYLTHYPNISTPPVSITSYTGCTGHNKGDNSYPNACVQAYKLDTSTIHKYNVFVSTHTLHPALPPISELQYTSASFGTNGFCYCAQGYTAFLQSIIDGVLPPSSVDTNMLHIAKYCGTNYQPPCKAYVLPDTGNSGFPNSNISNPFSHVPPPTADSSCGQYAKNVAVQNAQNQYNQYVDSLKTSIFSKYTKHCLGAFESFTEKYLNKQNHYTLYYYDQAGNLIRTVPPEGVHLVNIVTPPNTPINFSSMSNAADSICYDRTYNTHNFLTSHTMPTTYVYNSLNQLVKQSLPDHDPLITWEFALPNGIDNRLKITGVQFVNNNIGYLSGYINLPDTITPGIFKRGYIYTTSDGGKNWTQMQDVVAANLNKVHMVTKHSGYAVGKQGIILKTIDGAYTWDIVPTYNVYTNIWTSVPDWTDLVFTDSTKGVIVGSSGKSLLIDFTQPNPIKRIKPISLPTGNNDNFSGVTFDGNFVYASAVSANANYGYIYKSTLNPFTTDSLKWDSVTSFKGDKLLTVQFLADSTKGFIGGSGGSLLKTTNRGGIWTSISSNLTGSIRNLFFRNDSVGVALVDSVPGYAQLYKTSNGGVTWHLIGAKGKYYTDMSFYKYANPATADKAYVIGANGSINRLIANTTGTYGHSPYFGIAPLNTPNTHKNFTSVSATNYVIGTVQKSKVVIGTADGKIYYSYNNADSTHIIWDSLTLAASTVSLIKIGVSYNATTNTYAIVAVGSNGNLYGSKITNPSTAIPRTLPGSFTGIAVSKNGNQYTYDNVNKEIFQLGFSGTTLTKTLVGTANANIISGNGIGMSGNLDVFVVGDSSGIYSETTSGGWTSDPVVSAPLYDIQVDAGVLKAVYAVGKNGTLLQKSPSLSIWKKLGTGKSNSFNGIYFYRNTMGVIAADSGKAYTLSIDTTTYSLNRVHAVTPNLGQSYKDVFVLVSKEGFVAGDNGNVLYIHNVVTDTFGQKINLGAVTANFKGVQAGVNQLLLVGPSNNIYGASFTYSSPNIITNTILRSTNIFSQTINKAHFSDANNGYLVGDNGFIRHTADGITWQIVPPDVNRTHLDTLNNVFTYQADQALIVGQKGYLAKINTVNTPALISTTALGGTPDLNDISFGSNTPNQGYIVGSNKTAFKITLPNTITSLGTLPAIGSGYNLKALHVFLDNSFMAVGNKGVAVFYNAGNANWYEHDPPAAYAGTENFNDVCFLDDQNGFVVGDKGVVLRWTSYQNIQKLSSTNSAHPNFITKPTKTVLAYGVPDSTLININAIAFSDQNYGFMGGAYPDSINNADYARYIHDESDNFSTYFWYDALGRLVLSQNSKQFATLPNKTYSYTLYDVLGRIMEVGQKAENNAAGTNNLRFTNLFTSGQTNGRVDYTTLQNWLVGTRTEVTHTYYDSTAIANLPITQQNLRKRVSSVLFCDTVHATDIVLPYNHATHYTYDIHGNVNTLVQDNPSLTAIKQRYKRIDYNYDLISGKVNYVYYQQDSIDQFTHKYEYDADNRITDVYTSHDKRVWDRDAKYYYYAHGPLARVEYGQNQVQGMDYAYTIQGWIKGVNSDAVLPTLDMGKDGLASVGNPNRNFARDAFGYSLTYFKNDYAAIYPGWQTDSTHRFLASQYFDAADQSDLMGYRYDLFNGNIGTMVSTITNPGTGVAMPLATSYKYDQLNRLRQSASFDELLATQNLWNNENLTYSWESLAYQNRFTYDANGNIESQLRQDIAGRTFDSLIYHYNTQNGNKIQNRLYLVNDTIPASVMNDDIDNQGVFNDNAATINLTNNYRYDQIGNLIKDSAEGIAKIDWTVYGKIKSITHRTGYSKLVNGNTIYPPDLVFNYDAAGNRISKTVIPRTSAGQKASTYFTSTYYVRDAEGNVMSVYTQRDSTSIGAMYFTQTEKHLYGTSRIGIDETQTQLLGLTASADTSHHYAGYKLYELSNHLGNVLTTISDKKIPQNPQSPAIIYSTPDVVRTGIDSLGGMKIQPMIVNAGNHFTFPAKVGTNYKVDFYFNLANTNPDSVTGDWPVISYDANNTNGFSYNDLYHTGHYSFTLNAPDTLFDLKILYYGASNIPNGYMLVDSLQIVEVGNTKDTIVNYMADVRSVSDVSPFGAPLKDRTWSAGSYRYGFNGKEKDDEVKGAGNEYDYGDRIYDPRLGRFMSVDPFYTKYSEISPYAFSLNSPLRFKDKDGGVVTDPHGNIIVTSKGTASSNEEHGPSTTNAKGETTEIIYTVDQIAATAYTDKFEPFDIN
ncbi:MAG: RHS repeat-associated core domain-containing protein, partial [Bacteroidia bacterium]